MKKLFFIITYFLLFSCHNSQEYTNALRIKKYALDFGIYENNVIYFPLKKIKDKNFEFPNIKLYDSIGNALQIGSCFNAIENLLNKISSDSFKQIMTSNPSFTNYIDSNDIVCVDDLEKPKLNKKYKYYFIFHWNYGIGTINKDFHSVHKKMKTSISFAKENRIKIIFVHI